MNALKMNEFNQESNYQINLVDFPPKIKGAVVPDADGTFIIFINENLSEENRLEVLKHELSHIEHNDFDNFGESLTEMERRASQ